MVPCPATQQGHHPRQWAALPPSSLLLRGTCLCAPCTTVQSHAGSACQDSSCQTLKERIRVMQLRGWFGRGLFTTVTVNPDADEVKFYVTPCKCDSGQTSHEIAAQSRVTPFMPTLCANQYRYEHTPCPSRNLKELSLSGALYRLHTCWLRGRKRHKRRVFNYNTLLES